MNRERREVAEKERWGWAAISGFWVPSTNWASYWPEAHPRPSIFDLRSPHLAAAIEVFGFQKKSDSPSPSPSPLLVALGSFKYSAYDASLVSVPLFPKSPFFPFLLTFPFLSPLHLYWVFLSPSLFKKEDEEQEKGRTRGTNNLPSQPIALDQQQSFFLEDIYVYFLIGFYSLLCLDPSNE